MRTEGPQPSMVMPGVDTRPQEALLHQRIRLRIEKALQLFGIESINPDDILRVIKAYAEFQQVIIQPRVNQPSNVVNHLLASNGQTTPEKAQLTPGQLCLLAWNSGLRSESGRDPAIPSSILPIKLELWVFRNKSGPLDITNRQQLSDFHGATFTIAFIEINRAEALMLKLPDKSNGELTPRSVYSNSQVVIPLTSDLLGQK